MRNFTKYVMYSMLGFLLVSILFACSIVEIQKRHFRKGYSVHWNFNRTGDTEVRDELQATNKQVDSTVFLAEGTFSEGKELKTENTVVEADNDLVKDSEPLDDSVPNKGQKEDGDVVGVDDSGFTTETESSGQQLNDLKKGEAQDPLDKHKTTGWQFPALLGLILFPTLVLSKKRIGRSKKWAKNNKQKARVIIGLSTAIIGLSVVVLTLIFGITLSPWMLVFSGMIGLFGIVVKIIDRNKNRPSSENWANRLIMLSGYGMMAIPASTLDPEFIPHMPIALAIVLTILVLAVMLVLIGVVFVFSCSLSCNGTPYLALILAVGGVFLVVFLAFLLILTFYDNNPNYSYRRKINSTIIAGIFALIVSLPFLADIFL